MSKTFQRLDKSFFQQPKELGSLINKENLIHKYLPKQTDIDKMLRGNPEESIEGHSSASQNRRNTGRIFTQFIS